MDWLQRLTGNRYQIELAVLVCLSSFLLVPRLPSLTPRTTRRWLVAGAAICAVSLLAYSTQYLLRWTWYDHVEPAVVANARLLDHGYPLYHDLEAPDRYVLLGYGPGTYLGPIFAERVFGPSLIAAKLPAILFTLASAALVVVAIHRPAAGVLPAALGILYFCGMAVLFRPFPIMIRADAQMMFWAALSVLAMTVRPAAFRLALLGLAAGGMVLTKVHGVLYLAPAAVVVLAGASPAAWTIVPAVAAVVVGLPLLMYPQMDLANYPMWLWKGVRHGIDPELVPRVLGTAVFLAMPVLFGVQKYLRSLSAEARGELVRTCRLPVLAGAGALLGVVLLGVKAGAGFHHLMPFVPLGAYVTALAYSRLLADAKLDQPLVTEAAITAALVVPAAVIGLWACVALVIPSATEQRNREAVAEIHAIVSRYPNEAMAMGYGEPYSYEQTYLRTELPFQGKLVVDPVALMDFRQIGLPVPEATLRALRDGAVRYWLVPHGDRPFHVQNYYTGDDLFGPELREVFVQNYRPIERGRFFDVWAYRAAPGAGIGGASGSGLLNLK